MRELLLKIVDGSRHFLLFSFMPTSPAAQPVTNRLTALMAHTSRYSFEGPARLAADLGVPRSTVLRMLRGQTHPSFGLALATINRLEEATGHSLDAREVFSLDGSYPTPFVCDLLDCPGCLPDEIYDREDNVKPEFAHLRSGRWPPAVLFHDREDAS